MTSDTVTPNWSIVFNRLFKEIDGPKGSEFYYSGPDFIEKMQEVNQNTLEYPEVIAQRQARGQSTTRRDYFKDMFFELDEGKKVELVLNIVADIERRGHPRCEDIRKLLGGGTAGPAAAIPTEAWNSERLNDYLKKIDIALESKELERVLTLAYTCTEGLFKAFVRKHVRAEINENENNNSRANSEGQSKRKTPRVSRRSLQRHNTDRARH